VAKFHTSIQNFALGIYTRSKTIYWLFEIQSNTKRHSEGKKYKVLMQTCL